MKPDGKPHGKRGLAQALDVETEAVRQRNRYFLWRERMIKRLLVFLASTLIALTIGLVKVNAQQKKCDLTEKRVTIQITNKPIYEVFITLMNEYDVPIGFEESTLDADHDDYFFQTLMPPADRKNDFPGELRAKTSGPQIKGHLISLNLKDVRLEQVLDETIKQMQNYDWVINDGVVNIFPVKGRNPKFEKLLDIKIRGLILSQDTQYSDIQPIIVLSLPEFKAFLAENKLHAESDRYLPSYSNLTLPRELRVTDITFRQLLNDITRLKRGGWILRANKHSKSQKPEDRDKEFIELLI